MKKILTIAGSDPSGGAGIQADIKTITMHNMYAMSVITSLTAQNTVGVQGIFDIEPEFVKLQMESIFTDIVPDAVKVGMLARKEVIHAVAEMLKKYKVPFLVLDPVMVSTSGRSLLQKDAVDSLIENLFPIAFLITPNIQEAEVICGFSISCDKEKQRAAKEIAEKTHTSVLIKGGHDALCANDLLYTQGKEYWFLSEKIDNPNTHGTGCTLSSAIACYLAEGKSLQESVKAAKEYVKGAICDGFHLGKGRGPLNHLYHGIYKI